MNEYTYQLGLKRNIPKYMNIQRAGTRISEDGWYAHSYGEPVGRIYSDGRIESLIDHDIQCGRPEWFDELRGKGILESQYLEEEGEETFYVMYEIIGHSSQMPTVTYAAVKGSSDQKFSYTYEVLMVADKGFQRYVQISRVMQREVCLLDEMAGLIEEFEDWGLAGLNGFRFHIVDWSGRRKTDLDDTMFVKFYNDFGEEKEIEFHSEYELMACIHSIRIVDLREESK